MSFWIINPTFRKPWIISRGLVISVFFSLDYKLWIINLRNAGFCGHKRAQRFFFWIATFLDYNFFWIINPWIISFFLDYTRMGIFFWIIGVWIISWF